MKLLLLLLLLTSCAKFDFVRCFSIDGKASSSCERGLRADRLCEDHDGLNDYDYYGYKCNDGFNHKGSY